MRTVSGDQNRAEWRLKNWGVRMPCLLWTADKDRAARHEPVRLKSMNYLHLTCISGCWIRIYVVLASTCVPGQRFIGPDSSVQNATSHSPAKMSSWISLSPQEWKNTVNSSLLELSCSGARSSPFFTRGGGVRTSIGVASLAATKRYISRTPHSSIA